MKAKTAYTIIDRPAEELFEFMADVENHPKWAVEFIQEMKRENGNWKVITPFGEQLYKTDPNKASGVIDIYVGEEGGQMNLFPTRVVPLGDDQSVFLFTMFAEGIPENVFEEQFQSLQRELDHLQSIFT